MARNSYRVLIVGENFVEVTDGTKFQGELSIFKCTRVGIEGARTNDIISADDVPTNPTIVVNPFLEHGAAAVSLRPALYVAPVVEPFNPNDTGNAPLLYPDGSSLSPSDVDALLRQQAKLITDLTNRVRVIEVATKNHCYVCKSHIARNAFGDRRETDS
jgi:hypothetical protein